MLIYGYYSNEADAKAELTKLRRNKKEYKNCALTFVGESFKARTAEQEAAGMDFDDASLWNGWGVFGENVKGSRNVLRLSLSKS